MTVSPSFPGLFKFTERTSTGVALSRRLGHSLPPTLPGKPHRAQEADLPMLVVPGLGRGRHFAALAGSCIFERELQSRCHFYGVRVRDPGEVVTSEGHL